MDVDNFLEHYGVRGMRWGVRRRQPSRPASAEARKTSELRKRHPHQLTNRQLKTVNERLNLEKNFKGLNPTKVDRGLSTAQKILAVGTLATSLYGLSQTPLGKHLTARGAAWLSEPKNQKLLQYTVKKTVKKAMK